MLDVDATFQPDPQTQPASAPRFDAAAMLMAEAAQPAPDQPASPGDAAAASATPTTEAEADTRPVTPRRLLRFTSSRVAEDAPAIALPVPNIFEGVFDDEDHLTDPRLLRSRARARALLAAHEALLSDAERNLWHDDPEPEPPPPAPVVTETAQERSGRRVRHLTAADIAPHRPDDAPIHDSLRDRLQLVRAALYDPDPDAPPAPPPKPAMTERVTVQALNAALIITALPVGLIVSAITLLRGEDLRLSARAVAAVGAVTAFLQVVPLPLI